MVQEEVLRYFHNLGYNIIGVDFIQIAVENFNRPILKSRSGDITNLKYQMEHSDTYLLLVYIIIWKIGLKMPF